MATLTTPTSVTSADRVRQVVVLLGAVVAIGGAAVGSGAFGGQAIQDAAGGALSATATPLAPDGPAFSIWSLIYLGLAAFAVVQALPGRGSDPRLRAVSWWVLASMLLNALWIGVVQADALVASVLVIAVLLAVLALLHVRLTRTDHTRPLDSVVTDVTVGLYLGWVSVATLANIAAFLADEEVGDLGLGATGWSVVVLALAAVLSVAYAVFARRRPTLAIPVGVAMAWGLAWIAVGRSQGPLVDDTVAVAAGIASTVALVAPIATSVLVRSPHSRA